MITERFGGAVGVREDLVGLVIANELTIVRPLAEGGMGAVYVATQKSTGKERALKLMHREIAADPGFQRRFEQEARVGSRIASDHVVEVLAAGVDEKLGLPYLVMELLEGEDLRARLARTGPFSIEETRVVLEQLCHAMIAAHSAGVVHRDLKPENIFLSRSRRAGGEPFMVKVLDFGIAKLVLESNTRSTRGSMGSPLWMAPEQTAPGPVTSAADVWSMALLTYEMLVGKSYWKTANVDGGNTLQLLREIVLEPLPTASQRASEIAPERHLAERLPPGFDEWFELALAREPSRRFQDASAMARALPSSLAPRPSSLPKVSIAPETMMSALAETQAALPARASLNDETAKATPFVDASSAPPFKVNDTPPPPPPPPPPTEAPKDAPAAPTNKNDRRVVILGAIAVIAVAVAIGAVAGSMRSPDPPKTTAASLSSSAPTTSASASASPSASVVVAPEASSSEPITTSSAAAVPPKHAAAAPKASASATASSAPPVAVARSAPGGFTDPVDRGGAVTWKVQGTRVRLFTRLVSNESNVTDGVVRNAIEHSSWEYLRCYERVFGPMKDLPEGTVTVGFDILDQLPRHAKLVSSTFSSSAFNDCVVGTVVGQTINAAGPDGKGHAVESFRFVPN